MYKFLHFCVPNLFNSVKITDLLLVKKRAATCNSAYHLLFYCLLRYVCPPLSLIFGISFGFGFGQFLKYFYLFNFHKCSYNFISVISVLVYVGLIHGLSF